MGKKGPAVNVKVEPVPPSQKERAKGEAHGKAKDSENKEKAEGDTVPQPV